MSHAHDIPKFIVENASVPSEHLFSKLPRYSFIVGVISLVLAILIGQADLSRFFFSFHVSWLFYLSLAIGAIFFVLIQFAAKVGWSVSVRRLAENVGMTMPLFLVLLIVMYMGTNTLYSHWVSSEALEDPIIQAKQWYLNVPFFYFRAVFYLVMFSIAGFYFSYYSVKQDHTGSRLITYKLQSASYPFLIILGFCVTFAAFDWIMSLSPHWYSTIFGLYFFASCYVAFFALLIILTRVSEKIPNLKQAFNLEHYHDLGKLLFGHSCFWAYAAFCQYFLIWYVNLPEETVWYEVRQNHGWHFVFLLLIFGHFFVPFFFLMARKAKRSPSFLVMVSIWILLMHLVDIYWLVLPSHYEMGPNFNFIDLFCLLGIGGLFITTFCMVTRKKALVPIKDPRLPESLTYENV